MLFDAKMLQFFSQKSFKRGSKRLGCRRRRMKEEKKEKGRRRRKEEMKSISNESIVIYYPSFCFYYIFICNLGSERKV